MYAAIGIVLVVVVVALFTQPWTGSRDTQLASAEIAAYRGTVEVQSVESGTWLPADSAADLGTGVNIRTGDESSIVLSFPDDSKTLLSAHTELKIVTLDMNADNGDRVIVLQQESGRTQNYVQPMLSAGSRFEIRTPSATVTVRGTAFMVDVEADGSTSVAVSEGRVEVAAQGMSVMLDPGQGTTVQSGHSPAVAEPVPTVPIPSELATIISEPGTLSGEEEGSGDPEDGTSATPKPSATATSLIVSSPTSTSTPVAATETPTGSSSGPVPTNTPRPSDTSTPPQPASTATPPPPPPATTEPAPTQEPTREWVPPGQTKTPQPPGHTRVAPRGSSDKHDK